MTDQTQIEILNELHQAVVGIKSNPDDNGLIGDVKEVKELLKSQNKRIGKSEQKISKIWGILIGVGILGGGGLGVSLAQLLGG